MEEPVLLHAVPVRGPAVAALALALALGGLSACGADEATEPEGTVIPVTVHGDDVEPLGERRKVEVGETLTFEITSDTAGEMHVHSSPESEVAFGAGETTAEITIDKPGVVDVELHEPTEVTLLQLEVR